jgi:hypothetical protein
MAGTANCAGTEGGSGGLTEAVEATAVGGELSKVMGAQPKKTSVVGIITSVYAIGLQTL